MPGSQRKLVIERHGGEVGGRGVEQEASRHDWKPWQDQHVIKQLHADILKEKNNH